MKPVVRRAEVHDRSAILELVEASFSAPDHDGRQEVQIVTDTWRVDAAIPGLELVAVEDARVVGHILGARGHPPSPGFVAVAPLCVRTDRQGHGLGSTLMTVLLERAEEQRWPAVVLLGDPAFYSRFGFEPAGRHGLIYAPVGEERPYFQLRRLSTFDPSTRGVFRYCWESDP